MGKKPKPKPEPKRGKGDGIVGAAHRDKGAGKRRGNRGDHQEDTGRDYIGTSEEGQSMKRAKLGGETHEHRGEGRQRQPTTRQEEAATSSSSPREEHGLALRATETSSDSGSGATEGLDSDWCLESLPTEIVHKILYNLEVPDICELRLASTTLLGKVDGMLKWKKSWWWKQTCTSLDLTPSMLKPRYTRQELQFSLNILLHTHGNFMNTLIQAATEGYADLCSSIFDECQLIQEMHQRVLDPDLMKYFMQIAVAEAMKRSRFEATAVLLEKHPTLLADDSVREAFLKVACEKGSPELIRAILPSQYHRKSIHSLDKVLKAVFQSNSLPAWEAFVECTLTNTRHDLQNAGNIIISYLIQKESNNLIGSVLEALHVNPHSIDEILITNVALNGMFSRHQYHEVKDGFDKFVAYLRMTRLSVASGLHCRFFQHFLGIPDHRFALAIMEQARVNVIWREESAHMLATIAHQTCLEGLLNALNLGPLYRRHAVPLPGHPTVNLMAVFAQSKAPETMVTTEDDFFGNIIPANSPTALADNSDFFHDGQPGLPPPARAESTTHAEASMVREGAQQPTSTQPTPAEHPSTSHQNDGDGLRSSNVASANTGEEHQSRNNGNGDGDDDVDDDDEANEADSIVAHPGD